MENEEKEIQEIATETINLLLRFAAGVGVLISDYDAKAAGVYTAAAWVRTYRNLPSSVRVMIDDLRAVYRQEAGGSLHRLSEEPAPIFNALRSVEEEISKN